MDNNEGRDVEGSGRLHRLESFNWGRHRGQRDSRSARLGVTVPTGAPGSAPRLPRRLQSVSQFKVKKRYIRENPHSAQALRFLPSRAFLECSFLPEMGSNICLFT